MAHAKDIPYTQAELREWLDYDPQTGQLTWRMGRETRRDLVGTEVGARCRRPDGRHCVVSMSLGGRKYVANRIIWKLVHGEDPDGEVGYRNGDPWDLRLDNLRDVPRTGTSRNQRERCTNTSGYTGVSWFARREKWIANLCLDGKLHHLGYFTDKLEAAVVAAQARLEAGFTLRHATGGHQEVIDRLPDWLVAQASKA